MARVKKSATTPKNSSKRATKKKARSKTTKARSVRVSSLKKVKKTAPKSTNRAQIKTKTKIKVKTKPKTKTVRVRKKTAVIYSRTTWQARFLDQSSQLLRTIWHVGIYPYRWQLILSTLLTAIIIGSSYAAYIYIFKDLPSPQQLVEDKPPATTKILDRNGKELFRLYNEENRTPIPLQQVPALVINATIAIEDQHFYTHHGFSIRGITRATFANLQGKSIQGGSTITQQLVKNRLLSPERTLQRKLKEIILSILVDGTYTKEQILEMYLNEVAYGGSTYGIEAAAQRYFRKRTQDLTLAEASLLAGLPAAPSAYSPFGANPELAKARQSEVLRRMVEDGYITAEEAQIASQEPLNLQPDQIEINAPHFVMYVKQLLAEQYGEAMVHEGGLEVTTTLDLDLQQQVQSIVTTELDTLAKLKISNGAALVTNPQTGEILSMVGSKNYFDFAHDGQVNVTLRPRQPGSAIKPITYALAFEQGRKPSTTEEDTPITFQVAGSKPYSPKNYDGRYHGKVTLREALGSSYNIPAVKLLAQIGINSIIDKGQALGITTWNDRTRFGLSLTLGGGEVLMTDLATVYGTFANMGTTVDLNPLLEVKTYKGEVLYHNSCGLERVGCPTKRTLSSLAAYFITDVLSDNQARTPGFGPRSVLFIPNQQVAVKTGTTNNLRDNWSIGYSTDRLVAVWVGNNDNTPMSYVASGITGASPIWNKIMRLMLDDDQPHRFATPSGLIKVPICVNTGTLPCRNCPVVKEELFVLGTQPTQNCNPNSFASPSPSTNPTLPSIPRTRFIPTGGGVR